MSDPRIIKTNNTTVTVRTRPLGGGDRAAKRSASPFDTQSHLIARNRRIYDNANIYAGRYNNDRGIFVQSGAICDGGNNNMQKAMLGVQLGMGLANFGTQLYQALKSDNGAAPAAAAGVKTAGSLQAVDNGVITAMSTAKDSTALSMAINEAKVKQSEFPGEISTAQGELDKLKDNSADLKDASDSATADYNNHLEELQKANADKTQAQNKVTGCQSKFDSSKLAYDNSVTAYFNAESTVSSLEAQLAAAPPEQQAAIQSQLATAKSNLQQAESRMKEAEKNMNQAQEALNNAKEELSTAEKNLAELDAKTEELKNKQAEAKENYKQNLDDIKTKQDEIEKLQKEQAELDKAITQQENNLQKMKKDESSEFQKVSEEIIKLKEKQAKLMSQVNASDADGLSAKEERKNNRDTNLESRITQLESRQAELKILVDAH